MYTLEMKRAVHSLESFKPKNFGVIIEDNDNFLTIRAPEKNFMQLTEEGKRMAIEYMIRMKKALEENGAIVLIVREGGKED